MSSIQRFWIVFAVALILQTFIWHHKGLVDQNIWALRITQLKPQELTPSSIIDQQYSSTPGTLALFLAQLYTTLGVSSLKALYLSVTTLVSIAAATAASIAYRLSKYTWWWLAVGILMAAHPLYLQSTPVDAVGSALLALGALVFLWYVRQRGRTSLRSDILLAVLLGGALATRLHIAAVVSGIALLLLTFYIGWRRFFLIAGSMLAIMVGLNPYLGYIPGTYLRVGVFENTITYSHAQLTQNAIVPLQLDTIKAIDTGAASPFTKTVLAKRPLNLSTFSFASLAFLSMSLAIVYSLLWNKLGSNLPTSRSYILGVFGISGLVIAILITSGLYIPRYFFPVTLTWELLLPLFLLHLLRHTHITSLKRQANKLAVLLTAGTSVAILLMALFLPGSTSL